MDTRSSVPLLLTRRDDAIELVGDRERGMGEHRDTDGIVGVPCPTGGGASLGNGLAYRRRVDGSKPGTERDECAGRIGWCGAVSADRAQGTRGHGTGVGDRGVERFRQRAERIEAPAGMSAARCAARDIAGKRQGLFEPAGVDRVDPGERLLGALTIALVERSSNGFERIGEVVAEMLRLSPDEQDRIDRKEDLRHEDRDAAADERVHEPLERDIRAGTMERDDEHRGDCRLGARHRRRTCCRGEDQRHRGDEDDLPAASADEGDDERADADAERNTCHEAERLLAAGAGSGAQRDERGDRGEERLRVPGNPTGELPGDAGGERRLEEAAEDGAPEASPYLCREVAQRVHPCIFFYLAAGAIAAAL